MAPAIPFARTLTSKVSDQPRLVKNETWEGRPPPVCAIFRGHARSLGGPTRCGTNPVRWAAYPRDMHNPVAAALASVALGPEVVVDNLTMIPLLAKHQDSSTVSTSSTFSTRTFSTLGTFSTLSTVPAYLLLDDALASGVVEITEVSEQGSVPDLNFINRGAKPVLIVDGEELLGAKQNRIVNLTILVAAHSELTIPVSCVEAGRWRARSRSFTSARRTQYASGRAKRMSHVSYSLAMRGDRMSDQAEVWDDIAQKSSRLNAESPTSAMEAIFSTHETTLDAFVAGFQPVKSQLGALFAVNGVLVGFDLFDHASTLWKVLPKLVRSVAVDAIDSATAATAIHANHAALLRAQASQFLAVAANAHQHRAAAVGLGEDLRLTAPHVAGAALALDQHVIHVSAFALQP